MTKEQLQSNLDDLTYNLDDLNKRIDAYEIDEYDHTDQFNEALDEQGTINIGSLTFYPSDILKNLDPTAYRIALSEYVDSIDLMDDPTYQNLIEEREALESEIEEITEQLEELNQ